jgi:hypothetical protein
MAFLSPEGPKALLCGALTGSINLIVQAVAWFLWTLSLTMRPEHRGKLHLESWHPPLRRFASRTTILRRAMDHELFKGTRLRDLKGRTPLPKKMALAGRIAARVLRRERSPDGEQHVNQTKDDQRRRNGAVSEGDGGDALIW